ncbi:MAG: pitrilysin family protein [Planctomycetota bacterium]
MRSIVLSVIFLLALVPAARPGTSGAILPYEASQVTLDNGLRVIIVPTGFPNLVSLHISVRTGSRNEVEPGKTGFAHFFEHMMFRGTQRFPPEKYQEIVTRAGANQNAYTTDDYTNYYMTFAREDLEQMLELEADRFMNLDYPLSSFQTEALAVLGEYNKNVANPIRKLYEVQRNGAYTTHTYKHTTMGFLEDIVDMPNQYDYSRAFFDRWYRPEHCTLLLAGDVSAEEALPLITRAFLPWQPGSYQADIPVEPEPQGPVVIHHEWPTETAPLLAVSFHGPAFSETEHDSAALGMLLALKFGETSDLYRRLVQKEQKVDFLDTGNADGQDPSLLDILSRVKRAEDVPYVRDAILETVADCRATPVSEERLAEAISHQKYAFSASLDSTSSIASRLARYIRFRRSFDTLNNLYALYEELTPSMLQEAARKYLTDQRLVVTTLSSDSLPESGIPSLESLAQAAGAADSSQESHFLVEQTNSPQIVMKLLFCSGSADDPKGKEGLADLSARMVSEAGSDVLEYGEIQKLFYPMAGSFSAQVDREMTVFTGSIHKDNLGAFSTIALDMLLNPGLREEDLQRNRQNLLNALRLDLRSNNDEELGKERLQADIFEGTGYGHPTVGTVAGIESITLDDIKAFMRKHYTWGNLMIGLSGDIPESFPLRFHDELSTNLPAGQDARRTAAAPEAHAVSGLSIDIIKKDTRATAISFGHPIPVTRSHKDFVALSLARSWLGEHRSSSSHLYQRLREERGMNYGDYAYIEAFPGGMFRFRPEPNLARHGQIFEVWIRPVPPDQAQMALRIALHELEKLVTNGLTEEQFQTTRDFLMKNVYVTTDGQATGLGYQLDSWYYDIPDFVRYMRDGLKQLTLSQVNEAIARHLSFENLSVVMVTKDAEGLREQLLKDAFSPMTYNTEKAPKLLADDQVIGARKLNLSPEQVRITPVEEVFAR